MPTRLIQLLFIAQCTLLSVYCSAQPRDTLTTEQLLQRKGGAYAALLHPSKYLALDVNYRLGGFRRYRFFQGDEIQFRARGQRFREELYEVTDSTFVVLMANEVMNRDEPVVFQISEVQKVYINRRIPFVTAAGTLFPIAGGLYLLADVVNQGIFDKRTLPIAGGLALSGLIFHKLSNPRIRIGKNHRLRVLRTY
ncbi:hypothetical protein [Spirosoma montaniterrae]|uniref:DUF2846 domain-containing protein n=1 Tax=Spirosoma montaniterrae TaxID=1178516 RepID=A0A1P9WXK3_9BACT|nr:hypothetical protein [Spirosoma montaniterrae]AQG80107.1 hypothetical protein AWR27_12680 [Spirosoma montaniterrae]